MADKALDTSYVEHMACIWRLYYCDASLKTKNMHAKICYFLKSIFYLSCFPFPTVFVIFQAMDLIVCVLYDIHIIKLSEVIFSVFH